jgi:hypothetical protein
MNIFYIDESPIAAARALVDKHVVKMPLESAQMLSTAHRILDGHHVLAASGSKKKSLYLLEGETWDFDQSTQRFIINNEKCYKVAHAKHPSTVWTMQSKANYDWHLELFKAMLSEYTSRYGKIHSCGRLLPFLSSAPKNIPDAGFTPPTPAMPDKYKVDSVLESYRRYYAGDKWRFAKWKHGVMPSWFPAYMSVVWREDLDARSELISLMAQKYGNKRTLPLDGRVFSFGNKICYDASNSQIHTI